MKFVRNLPILLFAGVATPVLAQSAQDGFYTNGYAEISNLSSGGDNQTLGYSEATVGYTAAGSGLGAEFGVDALIAEGDDQIALYGAVTFQSSFGKLSFGVPRAAVDAYLSRVPTTAGSALYNIGEIGLTKRSYLSAIYLLDGGETPFGFRYDGSFGSTNLGASYSRYGDLDIYNIAANYALGETVLTGAVEYLAATGLDETRYFLGVETNFGQVTAGLLYSGNAFVTSGTAVEAYAKYKPMDQLELSATALNIDSGSSNTTLYGASADYTINQGIYVQGGIADTFKGSSDTVYNLALGLRF